MVSKAASQVGSGSKRPAAGCRAKSRSRDGELSSIGPAETSGVTLALTSSGFRPSTRKGASSRFAA